MCSASLLRPVQARFADLAAHEGEAERILRQGADKARVIAVTLPRGPRGPHLALAVGARRRDPWSMGFVTDTDTNGGRQLLMRKLLAISVASVGLVLLATTVFWADGGDHDSARVHDPASSDSSTTSMSIDNPTPSTALPGSTRPPTSGGQLASSNPAAAPRAEPEPLLADGRNPVFLTHIDVDGQTVEFDLLQYLTGAEQEAYEAAHPTEYAGCGCDDGGPIHNDNPRLRRLPVAPDMRVFLQGSTSSSCDGPNTTTFAAFPGYFTNGHHDFEPDTGHLGFNAFWLTVDHDTVVDIEEMSCAA